MISKNILTEEIKKQIWSGAKREIDTSVKIAERITSENPEDIFDFTFAHLPKNLQKEKKEFEEIFAEKKEAEA